MKICPLCKTKFEDSAEFCPKCKAQLEDLSTAEKKEKEPIPRSFWWALIGSFAFIGGLIALYNLIYSNFL
jgi:predicted amidophosphoribosyltransferase